MKLAHTQMQYRFVVIYERHNEMYSLDCTPDIGLYLATASNNEVTK